MSIKYTPSTVGPGISSMEQLNTEFQKIQAALARGLSRYSDAPNAMQTALDMGDNDLLNVGRIAAVDITIDGVSLEEQVSAAAASAEEAEEQANIALATVSEVEGLRDQAAASATAAADYRDQAQVAADDAEASESAAATSAISAARNAQIYEDTTAGLADTSEGEYFSVPAEENTEAFIIYRHDIGPSAIEVTRTASVEASLLGLNSLIVERAGVSYAQLAEDENGDLRVIECIDPNVDYRRFPEAPAVAAPTEYVVFLAAGQSNMDGRGGGAPVPPSSYGYAWSGSALFSLSSHIVNDTMLPAFAIEFVERTGLGVIIVKEATGGSAMAPGAAVSNGYWGGAGSAHRVAAITQLRDCFAYLRSNGYTFQFGGVLWSQGERDAQAIDGGDIVVADYDAGLADLMEYLRGELGENWPFYFVRTGRLTSGDTAGWQAIRDAQDRACAADQWLRMGTTTALTFVDRGLMQPDGIHYSQDGLNDCGKKLGVAASALSPLVSVEVS